MQLADVAVTALSSTWFDADLRDFVTSRDEEITAFDLPTVAVRSRLPFSLLDGSRPAGVSVREFGSVDADGIPEDSLPGVDCFDDTICTLVPQQGQVDITVPLSSAAVFVTIDVFYDIPELGLEQPYNLVSYGLNVRSS